MTDIKYATKEDLPELIELVKSFAKESKLLGDNLIPEEELYSYGEFFIDSPEHLTLTWDGGVFVAGIVKGMFSNSPVVSEILFYTDPEKRGNTDTGKILEILEEWTTARSLKTIVFHLLGQEIRGGFLKKAGYQLAEVSYVKEVGG